MPYEISLCLFISIFISNNLFFRSYRNPIFSIFPEKKNSRKSQGKRIQFFKRPLITWFYFFQFDKIPK